MKPRKFSSGDKEALDRPIWSALTSKHRSFAVGTSLACRYAPAVSPFAAASEFTLEAIADLRSLAADGPIAFLSSAMLDPLDGLKVQFTTVLRQMILAGDVPDTADLASEILGARDVPAMVELAALTRPGPFLPRTHQLGRYFGIRDGGRLVAMAGERMSLDGYTEISAVCVHPDYRGRGYAKLLVKRLMKAIAGGGEIPILHVLYDNATAIALYENVGFVTRRTFHLTVMQRADVLG